MASWIVHLRIAEFLLQMIDGLDAHYFAIGNIAPDSGIPDENWEKFDPPAHVLHFQAADAAKRDVADLVFYRRYVAPYFAQDALTSEDAQQRSFLWGYFFHLVTDNLWSHEIGLPTKVRFAAEFEADPKFVWQVKRDWYGLDFAYVRSHPDSIFWQTFLHCAYTEDYLDFLPQKAVQLRIDYIQTFYQRTDEEIEQWYIERPDLYLSEQEMNRFVEENARRLAQLYTILREGADITPFSSSLDLPQFVKELI
jgi:hypothetical protein